jgi:hypothetical protein
LPKRRAITVLNRGFVVHTGTGFCTLIRGTGMPRGGVLQPSGLVTLFKTRKSAEAAVRRTRTWLKRNQPHLAEEAFQVIYLLEPSGIAPNRGESS